MDKRKEHEQDVVVKGTPVTAAGPQEPVKAFKLLEGKQHTHDGKALKPGDVVLFSKGQAESFKDKFAPVDNSKFEALSPEEYNERVEDELERRANRDEEKK